MRTREFPAHLSCFCYKTFVLKTQFLFFCFRNVFWLQLWQDFVVPLQYVGQIVAEIIIKALKSCGKLIRQHQLTLLEVLVVLFQVNLNVKLRHLLGLFKCAFWLLAIYALLAIGHVILANLIQGWVLFTFVCSILSPSWLICIACFDFWLEFLRDRLADISNLGHDPFLPSCIIIVVLD